jgi:hypothetical protein
MPFTKQVRQIHTELKRDHSLAFLLPGLTLLFGYTVFWFLVSFCSMTPMCLRSGFSHVVQTLLLRTTPWLPTTSLLWIIKYSAVQRPWLSHRKQGKGGSQLQFLFVFRVDTETTRLATFTSYIIFLLCQLLTLGVLNKNFFSPCKHTIKTQVCLSPWNLCHGNAEILSRQGHVTLCVSEYERQGALKVDTKYSMCPYKGHLQRNVWNRCFDHGIAQGDDLPSGDYYSGHAKPKQYWSQSVSYWHHSWDQAAMAPGWW